MVYGKIHTATLHIHSVGRIHTADIQKGKRARPLACIRDYIAGDGREYRTGDSTGKTTSRRQHRPGTNTARPALRFYKK